MQRSHASRNESQRLRRAWLCGRCSVLGGCSTLFQRLDASRDGRISLDELISITRHTFRIHERCAVLGRIHGWMDGRMDGAIHICLRI